MAKFNIREAEETDITGIALLRQNIKEFRKIENEEYLSFWNSIIKSSPAAKPFVLVATDEQGNIVAHYAMVPFSFIKDKEPLLGGFLCQLMVHEKYRNELVFPRMELKFLKDYRKLGYDFVFSLGNRDKVVKAHLSFGFRKLGELPVYAKPYKLTGMVRRRIKSSALNALMKPVLATAEKIFLLSAPSDKSNSSVFEIPCFDSGIDTFLMSVQKYFPYSALRNSAVLNWRFAGSPSLQYRRLLVRERGEITGYAVLRRMDMNSFDILAIVDILFSPIRKASGISLLHAVHRIALDLNVEMSACLLNAHDPICPVLRKCGYYKTPETFSLFVHESKGMPPHFNENSFDKWHLTWFDNDAV